MKFHEILTSWYSVYKRDLPWRDSCDPYRIWLSEIILQQTRVQQGLPYFERFISAYPTVNELANAQQDEVLKLWQGLGYYSRARNLHATAKIIAYELNGNFPTDYVSLQSLKGVGKYTAAAIASFAYNEPVAVVDGNVYRFLSRYIGDAYDISSSGAHAYFYEKALKLMSFDQANVFNQAMMEFGALQCVPRNPNCTICVFNESCVAFERGLVEELPYKSKRTKVTKRYINYLVYEDVSGKTILKQRKERGIWQQLFEFPSIESDREINEEELTVWMEKVSNEWDYPNVNDNLVLVTRVEHKLSHQHLFISFWSIALDYVIDGGIDREQIKQLAVPVVMANFLDKHFNIH